MVESDEALSGLRWQLTVEVGVCIYWSGGRDRSQAAESSDGGLLSLTLALAGLSVNGGDDDGST